MSLTCCEALKVVLCSSCIAFTAPLQAVSLCTLLWSVSTVDLCSQCSASGCLTAITTPLLTFGRTTYQHVWLLGLSNQAEQACMGPGCHIYYHWHCAVDPWSGEHTQMPQQLLQVRQLQHKSRSGKKELEVILHCEPSLPLNERPCILDSQNCHASCAQCSS